MKRYAWVFLIAAALILSSMPLLAQSAGSASGKVVSVNAKNRTLVITGDQKGLKRTFYVGPEARITKKGEPVTLRALHTGDWVSLKLGGTTVIEQVEVPIVVALRAPEKPEPPPVAAKPAAPAPAPTPAPAPPAARPAKLPKTAGPLPAIGLLGLGLLALAGGLSVWRRRIV